MAYPLFQTKTANGIVVARKISFVRKPEQQLYGITDQAIYERGFLNFNYHPDQWGGISYSYGGFPGTKINGLPIQLVGWVISSTLTATTGDVSVRP